MRFKLIVVGVCILTFIGCSNEEAVEWKKVLSTKVSSEIKIVTEDKESESSEEMEVLENRQKKIALENTLTEEGLKSTHTALLQELQKLKWDKEILSEKFELQKMEDEKKAYEEEKKYDKERKEQEQLLSKLGYKANLAEIEAKQLASEIELERSAIEFKQLKLDSELAFLKSEKTREVYIAKKVTYLDNPLSEDNQTLTISDRRVELNGMITDEMASSISKQINYFNNKDNKKPIFLVIDRSEGGAVMAGNLILRTIDSSEAPVYVVVKSLAASMAAVIVTLSERSYAYPHAVLLHHQAMTYHYNEMTNLTEEREQYETLEDVWSIFGVPVAQKMNITSEEFIKQMYEHSSKGNWQEFAVDAQKLKWVNNIVRRIIDKSVRVDPMYKEEGETEVESYDNPYAVSKELIDKEGKPFMYLPRLSPADSYLIYNPDGYYRMR